MSKKHILYTLILLLFSASILTACGAQNKNIFDIMKIRSSKVKEVNKIVIWRYGGSAEGQTVEITDKETIKAVTDDFVGIDLKYDKRSENIYGGKQLRYTFYKSEKELGSFEFQNDIVKFRNKLYKVVSGGFDEEFLRSIEPKIQR